MPEIVFIKDINAPVEAVFDQIADLPNYDKWLPLSGIYKSLTEYSELPVRAGTTYVDSSRMIGTVTTFERPKAITFRQLTTPFYGKLDIEIRYTLEAAGSSTHLTRWVNIKTSGVFWVLQPYLVRVIRAEIERTLEKMKEHLEVGR